VEDRTTPGLYLELGDFDAEQYGSGRARELLARPGVARVSWWATNVPGRDELPMTVTDGTLLGVAEVDDGFVAPEPPVGTAAVHFVRTPRPSQGILTGGPTTGLLVVWISPRTPELAQPLRDWADFVHIRHIAAAAVPGFTHIAAYENTSGAGPRYMHFYELDAEDPEASYMAMARHMARYFGGARSEAFGEWADFGAAGGQVDYCNTFRLLGATDGAASGGGR
jgi:hypothetical protein